MRIRNLLIMVIIGSLIVITSGLTLMFYFSARGSLMRQIDQELYTAAVLAKNVLPPNYHDHINDASSVSSEEYQQIVGRFDQICSATELEYLWSMMIVDDTIFLTSSTTPRDDVSQQAPAQFFEKPIITDEMPQTFALMRPVYFKINNQWGHFRAINVPEYDARGRKFFVGAAIRIDDIEAQLNELLRLSLLVSSVIILLGALGGYLLANRLSALVARFITATTRIAAGDYTAQAALAPERSFIREITSLVENLRKMASAIQVREESLRKGEERYRLLTGNIQDVVWVLDAESLFFRYISPSVYRQLGYSADEVMARPFSSLFAAEDQQLHTSKIPLRAEDFLSGKAAPDQFYVDEMKVLRKDGSTTWIEAVTSYYVNQESGVVEVRGVSRDINRRKQAREALERSEAFLSKSQEISHVGSWELNPVTRELTWTDEVYRIFGLAPQEIDATYEKFYEMVPLDERQAVEAVYLRSIEEQLDSFEIEHRVVQQSSGEVRHVFEKAINIKNETGRVIRTLGTIQDITQIKQAADLLEQEKMFSDAIISSVPGLLYLYDADGHLLRWNKRHEELTGYSAEDLDHFYILDWYRDEPEDIERITQGVQRALVEGYASAEGNLICKNGEKRLFDFTAVRLDLNGKVYFTGIGIEITERRRAEQEVQAAQIELRKLLADTEQSRQALLSLVEDLKISEDKIMTLNTGLEQRVAERTSQLTAANRELEAFSYSVSHDLRAPLRAVNGFTQALLEDYGGQLDEQAQQYISRILESSLKMGKLIDDLLNLSRITRADFNLQQIDLSAMARQIAAELGEKFPERQVEYIIDEDLLVSGDGNLLEIAMRNLIHNAHKFTEKSEQARIEIGQVNEAGRTVYFVRDNGAGFDMEYAGKLFTPFQRLHNPDDFAGTGIGLSIVQRIIARHGGKIWPDAAVGRGATFYFTIGENGA